MGMQMSTMCALHESTPEDMLDKLGDVVDNAWNSIKHNITTPTSQEKVLLLDEEVELVVEPSSSAKKESMK